jgi:hypothetical protein
MFSEKGPSERQHANANAGPGMTGTRSHQLNGNPPAALNSLVGRRREIAEVKRLVSVAWLVNLTSVSGRGQEPVGLPGPPMTKTS